MSKAMTAALREEMNRDENVIILGEDMGAMGSPWGVCKGLFDEFGANRVIETPIAEASFMGMAVGAAMRGLRPVVELMYVDFVGDALDPIMNQAAKLGFMTGGQVTIPMVVRGCTGTGRHTAGQHSQSLEALFTHIPGLKVVAPSNAYDAKGLLKSAIRDDDPVIFLEHQMLYAEKCEVPAEEYIIPLGRAAIKRTGKDLTILTWSLPVRFCMEAAEDLAKDGIDAEVIDLRSLIPLDWEAIKASVEKTHRVMTVEYGVRRSGVGAELSAQITEELFDELDAPVLRLATENVVTPYSPVLEDTIHPTRETVYHAGRHLMGKE